MLAPMSAFDSYVILYNTPDIVQENCNAGHIHQGNRTPGVDCESRSGPGYVMLLNADHIYYVAK